MRFHNATRQGIRRAIRSVCELSASEIPSGAGASIYRAATFDSFDGQANQLKRLLAAGKIDDDVFWRLAPLIMKGQMLYEEGFE